MGRYTLKDTKSGMKTLVYENGGEVRLHSAYDPEKEARRAVDSFSKGRASLILVCGVGLGYHIRCLREKFPDTAILALERDREAAELATGEYPDAFEGVPLLTAGDDISGFFESLDISEFRGMARYIHLPSYGIDKDFYNRKLADIGQFISSKISDLLTRFEFEALWTENIFMNIPAVSRAAPVAGLFGLFRGTPGVIVSAGPSLRKNMDLLQGIRDRAVIVSVDTAAKVLEKRGISPHIIITLDAQKHSMKHFLGFNDSSPALLADLVCCPKVLRDYRGDVIVSSTSKYYTDNAGTLKREATPVVDWIERHIPPIGDIQSGGSVATSAFDLLLNLGCDPIILVGQDLAYTGREIHCSGTHHNDGWFPTVNRLLTIDTINQRIIRKRKTKMIQAYGGVGTVISDFVFDLYRNWFEDSAAKVPVAVINATEGGGRIQNTAEESLESLSMRLPILTEKPGPLLKNALSRTRGGDLKGLRPAVARAISRIRDILARAEALDEGDNAGIDEIAEMIDGSDLKTLFTPVMRKATLYLVRKKVEPDRGFPLLLDELKSASKKLLSIMEKSLSLMPGND